MIKTFTFTLLACAFSILSMKAEESEKLQFTSLKLNSSYVKVSDGYDDAYNQSLLLNSEYENWLKIGLEAFYTEWNNETFGGGVSLTAKMTDSVSLYADYYGSDKGNDLPKDNLGLGVYYDSGDGSLVRTTFRHRRFRNNQTVDSLSFEYIHYFVAEINYFSVLQLGLTPEYVTPGEEYGFMSKVHYSYGKIDDWRLGTGVQAGHSSYVSVIDQVTESSNYVWGVTLEAGKYITKNLELGLQFNYTDAQVNEATAAMLQAYWRF